MGALLSKLSTAAPLSVSQCKRLIDELVSTHPVVIFSATYCPYCQEAKAAVAAAGAEVEGFRGAKVVEVDLRAAGMGIRRALVEKTGRRTVPNVYVGGRSIGGGDETARLGREGVLKQLIRLAVDGLTEDAAALLAAATPPPPPSRPATVKPAGVATFGAGCFWGVELAFQRAVGVVATEVGYAGGRTKKTSYEAVCKGKTGHAEVVRVMYDPEETSFEALLELWEKRHDPTSLNKQGNDKGTQYRSAIFYHSEAQRLAADQWRSQRLLEGKNIVTEIAPEKNYCRAETYHQRYLERKGQDASKGATAKIRCYG